jgi:hypothetical protein
VKFRRLSIEELELFKVEFIQFLIVNGIVASEWEQLKKENSAAVDIWIDQFSDIVLEKSLLKISYLEYREKNQLLFFKCVDEEIELASIHSEELDLLTIKSDDLRSNLNHLSGINLMFKNKPYKPNRAEEVFRMIQSGALITDGKLFETLKHLVKK